MSTIAVAINLYNEAIALPGCLEAASQWADNIFVIHSSPGGKPSNDGTMEILERWGITPIMADISVGFGVIRTRLVQECGCDWAWICDADERAYKYAPLLSCEGDDKFPEAPYPKLTVQELGQPFNQIDHLQHLISNPKVDAVITRRMHWMDFTFSRPAQNFDKIPDWQARIVRNNGKIGYDPNIKMHERIINFQTGREPFFDRQSMDPRSVTMHHFHNALKPLHPEKNKEDIATYAALDAKGTEGMWIQYAAGVKE